MPDEARARAGGPRGGIVPPPPSQVAALRCRLNGLLLPGCVRPGTGGGRVLLPLTASRGGGAPWRWPAPGSRTRLPVAATLFLPPAKATQCNLRSLLRQGQAPSAPPSLQSCFGRSSLRSLDTRFLRLASRRKEEEKEKAQYAFRGAT